MDYAIKINICGLIEPILVKSSYDQLQVWYNMAIKHRQSALSHHIYGIIKEKKRDLLKNISW